MATATKSLFGGPVKNISCCTSAGFQPEHKCTKEKAFGVDMKRRWSSEEQYHRTFHAETRRRNSFYTQQKAERAAMREHFRSKYNLPKNTQDQHHVKEAGGNKRMSRDVRAVIQTEESPSENFSMLGFLGFPSLGNLKKGTQSTMDSLQSGTRCSLM
ncbi:complexin-3 [Pelobates cultripes]|uniref:Complexin-3 n=1 Tax=Pelobates cultripes TaxID=61616 RepID=A0AAD1TJ58_PELCU|nr:complexin-3 [Pelobates cultripes]